jgi:hypothetical protein
MNGWAMWIVFGSGLCFHCHQRPLAFCFTESGGGGHKDQQVALMMMKSVWSDSQAAIPAERLNYTPAYSIKALCI